MSQHRVGISGSVIMTDPTKFDELFDYEVDHIEIGEFPDLDSFQQFLEKLKSNKRTFGLHSPLLRGQSKYDLLEHVYYEPEQAWLQFESEVKQMASLGAEYILVHFPYFKEEGTSEDVQQSIEQGLERLSALQDKYALPIVCEPKLGWNRSPVGIQALQQFPIEIWEQYGLHLCIDIGDYLLAVGEQALDYIKKWRNYIKVVHLHNVEDEVDDYFWIPVHPSHEHDHKHFKIQEMLLFLASCKQVHFIFEHTPHTNPSAQMVEEGVRWVKELVGSGQDR